MVIHIQKIRRYIRTAYHVDSKGGHITLMVVAILGMLAVLGLLANHLVVAANDGKMPVFLENPEIHVMDDRHSFASEDTAFPYLADYIHIDGLDIHEDSMLAEALEGIVNLPIYHDRVSSPGDILMRAGILLGITLLTFLIPFALWKYHKQRRK